jgi:hypothetical protein
MGAANTEEVKMIRFLCSFLLVPCDGVKLSSLVTSATNWPTALVTAPRIDDECGAVGGMKLTREIEVLRKNLPYCRFPDMGSNPDHSSNKLSLRIRGT